MGVILINFQSLTVHAADMYRSVDSRGTVHYSDMPSPDAEKINPGKFLDKVTVDENLPYATSIAKQNFPVTLYVSSGCGDACNKARNLLNKRGIPYSEKSLSTRDDIDALKKHSGNDIVPTLAVGKSYLNGFQSEQWHSELDIAGYPRIAPYRAPNIESSADNPSGSASDNPVVNNRPATP